MSRRKWKAAAMMELVTGLCLLLVGGLLSLAGWACRRWVLSVEGTQRSLAVTHRKTARRVCTRIKSLERVLGQHERELHGLCQRIEGFAAGLPCVARGRPCHEAAYPQEAPEAAIHPPTGPE